MRELAERIAAAEDLKKYNIMKAAAAKLRELEIRAAAAEVGLYTFISVEP